jgi:hypothetical protein
MMVCRKPAVAAFAAPWPDARTAVGATAAGGTQPREVQPATEQVGATPPKAAPPQKEHPAVLVVFFKVLGGFFNILEVLRVFFTFLGILIFIIFNLF